MTTAALRAALVVIGVVLGAILLANAFPSAPSSPVAANSPSSTPSKPAHNKKTPSPTPPQQKTCKVQGVHVAVENGTSAAGLAAATAAKLQAKGYVVEAQDIGNAPAPVDTTTVYFAGPDVKFDAKCLRKKFFKGSLLKPLTASTGAPADVDIAVFLGADYAAANPVT